MEDVEELGGKLYCKMCFDIYYANVCEICKWHAFLYRKVIKDERSIVVSNKNYHNQHFCCAKCGVCQSNKSYYEKDNLIFCEVHIREVLGGLFSFAGRLVVFVKWDWLMTRSNLKSAFFVQHMRFVNSVSALLSSPLFSYIEKLIL